MLNNTTIPSYDGIKPKPFPSGEEAQRTINKIAICISAYVIVVMYPLYTLLRWFWNSDYPLFDVKHAIVAILTGLFFGWFSRRSMIGRVIDSVSPSSSD